MREKDRDGGDTGDRRKQPDDYIQVGDRRHASQRGENDHEPGNDVHANIALNAEGQVQDVAAAAELIRSDGGKSKKNGDGP